MKDYVEGFEKLVGEPGLLIRLSEKIGDHEEFPPAPQGLRVYWDTLCSCRGWKLQKNYYFDHYRILDEYNVNRASALGEKMIPALKEMIV